MHTHLNTLTKILDRFWDTQKKYHTKVNDFEKNELPMLDHAFSFEEFLHDEIDIHIWKYYRKFGEKEAKATVTNLIYDFELQNAPRFVVQKANAAAIGDNHQSAH